MKQNRAGTTPGCAGKRGRGDAIKPSPRAAVLIFFYIFRFSDLEFSGDIKIEFQKKIKIKIAMDSTETQGLCR